ncbi:uncharacterized protein [Populus alba]|uniref:uncharacterized protein isoform X2 n=1 Tax=Populus alba TaxID=43335 RepID=UPI003CC71518
MRDLWTGERSEMSNSISFFISISPVEIAIKFVPLWCFEVRKALGSNWAVFSFEWLYFLMKRNRFEGNLDSGVVDMNAYIIELQGTHKDLVNE